LTQIDDNTYEYTPQADYDGEDSFTYNVSDGNGGLAVGTCVLKSTPVNDGPEITIPAGSYSTDEDTTGDGITVFISDKETTASSLIVTAYSNDTDKITKEGREVTTGRYS